MSMYIVSLNVCVYCVFTCVLNEENKFVNLEVIIGIYVLFNSH